MKLRRYALLLVLVAALGFVSCDSGPDLAKWTILAYMDGNNNLDYMQNGSSFVIGDAQEMEKVGSTDQVEIMAMVGSLRNGGNSKYYHIELHPSEMPDSISSTVLEDLGGKDMSDKATLLAFIRKGTELYPAEHYMLIIDDHGGGWYGACEDEQNGAGDMMSMPEMREALDTFRFDVVVYHACLMGMVEVAYELKDNADYMVACQFTMPMQSILGSDKWLADLVADPAMSARDLSSKVVDAVYATAVEKQKDCHMAATDLSQVGVLAQKISVLGNNLVTEAGSHWNEFLQAFTETHYTQYDHPAFVDLREYCKKVKQMPNLQNINMIKNAADDVISAINATVVKTTTNVPGIPRGGFCIHFPYQQSLFDSSDYVKLRFASTNWQNFLSNFIGSTGGGGGDSTCTVTGTVTRPGGTLTNFCVAYLDTVGGSTAYHIIETAVNPANGSFQFQFIINGDMQVLAEAWDDVNNNGWPPDTDDGWGFYDLDGDQNWTTDDLFTIGPGRTISSVNIALGTVTDGHNLRRLDW